MVVAVSVAVAGGTVAIGVSIGAAVARNRIGLDFDYSSDEFVDPFTGADEDDARLRRPARPRRARPHRRRHARPGLPLPRPDPAAQLADALKLSEQNYRDRTKWAPVDADYQSDQYLPASGLEPTTTLRRDQRVRVAPGHAAGGVVGSVYRFLGSATGEALRLGQENYANTTRWALEGSSPSAAVEAVLRSTSVAAGRRPPADRHGATSGSARSPRPARRRCTRRDLRRRPSAARARRRPTSRRRASPPASSACPPPGSAPARSTSARPTRPRSPPSPSRRRSAVSVAIGGGSRDRGLALRAT